ncbi:hypothetical protein LCGC14_2785550 [marine sediment metagenome]|uniref:Uncharacterized protein n=1 Tax=marine sediment metagenome TaxID=412755 RepID=A0A0F8YS16_9ZZZZ
MKLVILGIILSVFLLSCGDDELIGGETLPKFDDETVSSLDGRCEEGLLQQAMLHRSGVVLLTENPEAFIMSAVSIPSGSGQRFLTTWCITNVEEEEAEEEEVDPWTIGR